MSQRRKVALILGTLVGCCLLMGLGLWVGSGYGPAERRAGSLYDEMQSIGVPLDTDKFEAALAVPEQDNAAPKLIEALTALDRKRNQLPIEQKKKGLLVSNWKRGPVLSAEDQQLCLSRLEPEFSAVRANLKRPRFWIKRDYALPTTVLFPEFARMRFSSQLCSAAAVLHARQGKTNDAVEALRDIFRLSHLVGDSPSTLISGLVSVALYNIGVEAVAKCVQLDSDHLQAYANLIPPLTARPVGSYLRSEVYTFAATLRNLASPFDAVSSDKMLNENKREFIDPPRRSGQPQNSILRAELGFGLGRWLPIMQALNPDGSPKDPKSYPAIIQKFEAESDQIRGPLGIFFTIMAPVLAQGAKAWTASEVRRELADAYIQVVAFWKKNGRWPETLPVAGVTQLDRLSPTPRPFGYRIEVGGMRLWSVSRDGQDNGGYTTEERKEKKLVDKARDEVLTFTEGL